MLDSMIYPQVIVAGMSRTGTESLKRALEILYGNTIPAYHMLEVLNKPKHLKFWSDLVFERISLEEANWNEIFAGYIATTDLPSAYYFDYIAAAFPNAKVNLSLIKLPALPFSHLTSGLAGPSRILSQAMQRLSLHRALIGLKIVLAVAIVMLAYSFCCNYVLMLCQKGLTF